MLNNKLIGIILFLLISIAVSSSFFIQATSDINGSNTPPKAYIALIIDDFGNYGEGTAAILNLDIPLTVAVIPFMPSSKNDAQLAHNAGIEVIMHVPMEPIHGKPAWLGPKGITCDLSDAEIKSRINDGLTELQPVTGINNHMGSKATQDKRVMKAVLEIAKQQNLFFVDSKTTANSVILETAHSLDVICFERDIFLDNSKIQADIEKQLLKLADIALKNGFAIGIGHVGIEGGNVTAAAIQSMVPILEEKGIRFVSMSELIKLTN
ncbi:divergent polysaccharide deacetylase family protein [Peptococcaceae bacterium]|nr:divergent polysaccharide deacetylase family protein [Peptococcaceae bacterium]